MNADDAANRKLPDGWEAEASFDGGETGCGELVLNLQLFFRDLAPGTRVAVRATDPGAPIDLPAWSRMTNNPMIASEHPHYLMKVGQR